MLWCDSELNHCPSKFHFWIQKLLFRVVLQRLSKPRHKAHDDGSQFERFTCSSSGKKKLSLNLATLKNASLTSRGQSMVIGRRSFTANYSSFVSTCQCWFPWQGPIRSQKNWSGLSDQCPVKAGLGLIPARFILEAPGPCLFMVKNIQNREKECLK